jgi:hypothetical protein
MAEPTPPLIPVAERPTDPQVYQPVAGLAIAGALVAGAYVLILVASGLAALSSGSPLLLPWPLSIGLPVVAAVLALLARRQIRSAEGTRAGLSLATWAWWLSVVGGLGYGAYYAATYSAVRAQAGDFADRWFDLLKKGKVNQAFLLSQEPRLRQGIDENDDEAIILRFNTPPPGSDAAPMMGMTMVGLIDQFKGHEAVRAMLLGGPETQVTAHAGLRDWEYSAGHYKVRRYYQITTREGQYDLLLTLLGTTSSSGTYEGRQWHVDFRESQVIGRQLTPYGQMMGDLQARSATFLMHWTDKLAQGSLEQVYLETCEPTERDRLHNIFLMRIILLYGLSATDRLAGAWPMALFPYVGRFVAPEYLLDAYMPGYAEGTRKLCHVDEKQFPDEATRKLAQECFQDLFRPRHSAHPYRGMMPPQRQVTPRPPVIVNGRVQCIHDGFILFAKNFRCPVTATLETEADYEKAGSAARFRIVRIDVRGLQDMDNPRAGRPKGSPPGR